MRVAEVRRKSNESVKVSVFAVAANVGIVLYSIFIYVCRVGVAVLSVGYGRVSVSQRETVWCQCMTASHSLM